MATRACAAAAACLLPFAESAPAAEPTTVSARARPEFDPTGVRAGGFTLYPAVTLSTGFDTNARGIPGGSFDVYAQARTSVRAISNWSRHRLEVSGSGWLRRHASNKDQDYSDYRLGAFGRLDVTRENSVDAEAYHARVSIARTATGELLEATEPVRYAETAGRIAGTMRKGRITARASAFLADYDFADTRGAGGVRIDQDYRDRQQSLLRLDGQYWVGPARALFLALDHETNRYRGNAGAVRRDSNGVEITAGLRSEITPVIRGQIGIGYVSHDFLDPRLRSARGLAIDTRLDWLVTDLTTVSLTARRTVEPIADVNSPAAIATSFRLRADHELLRNLIVFAEAGRKRLSATQIERFDSQSEAGIGATWTLNPRLVAGSRLRVLRREANRTGDLYGFTSVQGTIDISFRL